MGWAVRQRYRGPMEQTCEEFLLGRYFFSNDQQEHMKGYVTGVFETRQAARNWLKDYKARNCSSEWSRNWNRNISIVQVKVMVKEIT